MRIAGSESEVERGESWRVLSRTAEYALRATLYIAGRGDAVPVPVTEVAAALRVPEKYLAHVLNTLGHSGLLRSTRGAHGGFRLALPAGQLSLAELLTPFDAVGAPVQCLLRGERCGADGRCPAHEAWHDATASVRRFLERTTVADLLAGPDREASAAGVTTHPRSRNDT